LLFFAIIIYQNLPSEIFSRKVKIFRFLPYNLSKSLKIQLRKTKAMVMLLDEKLFQWHGWNVRDLYKKLPRITRTTHGDRKEIN
jgi:hypothetical protein